MRQNSFMSCSFINLIQRLYEILEMKCCWKYQDIFCTIYSSYLFPKLINGQCWIKHSWVAKENARTYLVVLIFFLCDIFVDKLLLSQWQYILWVSDSQHLCSFWKSGFPTICWIFHGYQLHPIVSRPILYSLFISRICSKTCTC